MKIKDFEISREETDLYVTLSFFVPTYIYQSNTISNMCFFIKKILEEYNIFENNIDNIVFERVKSNKLGQIVVKIKYYKMDILELNSINEIERIRKVLNYMGYTNENIKKITKEKSKSNNEYWLAIVYDSNYDFDPDESFSARDYEIHKNKQISDILGFTVNIRFL